MYNFNLYNPFISGKTKLSNFSYVTMPNLRRMNIWNYPESTLPSKMLYNLPGLESFELENSQVETIPDDFFAYVTSCRNFWLYQNKIKTIDLGSLNPNAVVDLHYNQINQLPEKNFRPFVENVLYTPNANGTVLLDGNFLS